MSLHNCFFYGYALICVCVCVWKYISTIEACWRIFQLDMFYRKPTIERLPFHLLNEHAVIFEEDCSLDEVVNRNSLNSTKIVQWMCTKQQFKDVKKLTYMEFPSQWVWHDADMKWRRKNLGSVLEGFILLILPVARDII